MMNGCGWLCVVLIFSGIFLTGCNGLSADDGLNGTIFKNYWISQEKVLKNDSEPVDKDIIYTQPAILGYRIGSYNLQIFGKTKANNQPVIQGYRQVMNDYDILAIQEIRDISETAFPGFMRDQLPQYDYVISERLGRTSSKEQYAWIWSDRVSMSDAMVFPDGADWFERPPYAMKAIIDNEVYILIQVHIKPDAAEQEIPYLIDVVSWAEDFYSESDIILLGDMNADCYYYDGNHLDIYESLISDSADTTTTRSDCAYDRIYIKSSSTNILESGVDRFEDDGVNEELAKAMSDHWIIYMVMG